MFSLFELYARFVGPLKYDACVSRRACDRSQIKKPERTWCVEELGVRSASGRAGRMTLQSLTLAAAAAALCEVQHYVRPSHDRFETWRQSCYGTILVCSTLQVVPSCHAVRLMPIEYTAPNRISSSIRPNKSYSFHADPREPYRDATSRKRCCQTLHEMRSTMSDTEWHGGSAGVQKTSNHTQLVATHHRKADAPDLNIT